MSFSSLWTSSAQSGDTKTNHTYSVFSVMFVPSVLTLMCRMAEHMELLGADYCEHNVFHPGVGVTRLVKEAEH